MTGSHKVSPDRIINLGSLVTMLTAVVGGAFFVSDLNTTMDGAVRDLEQVKDDIREMRVQVSSQTAVLAGQREQSGARDRRIEVIEDGQKELRERVRALELKVRDR